MKISKKKYLIISSKKVWFTMNVADMSHYGIKIKKSKIIWRNK